MVTGVESFGFNTQLFIGLSCIYERPILISQLNQGGPKLDFLENAHIFSENACIFI